MLGHVWSVVLSRILSTAALVFFAFAQMSAFAESRLSNISTRGAVGTDDNVMIGGVIIEGSTAKTVVVRAYVRTLSLRPKHAVNMFPW